MYATIIRVSLLVLRLQRSIGDQEASIDEEEEFTVANPPPCCRTGCPADSLQVAGGFFSLLMTLAFVST